MMKTFTAAQMLEYWKRRLGFKASSKVSGVNDQTQLDTLLMQDIDEWYEDILLSAPPEKVPTRDGAEETAGIFITVNACELYLPEDAVRMVALRMEEWPVEEVETYSVYSDIGRLQRNRLTRATVDDPVVLSRPGRLEVHGVTPPESLEEALSYSASSSEQMPPKKDRPKIARLEVVYRPPEGTYILDTSLLRQSRLSIHPALRT